MRFYDTPQIPKMDPALRESLWMKSEERADAKAEDCGQWAQNPPFRSVYLSAQMLRPAIQQCAECCDIDGHYHVSRKPGSC